MKQRIPYTLDRERKALFEANKDFADHMSRIFLDHLKVEYWTDADEDGLTGGVTISMEYEPEPEDSILDLNIYLEDNKIEAYEWTKVDDQKEIEFTEDQLKIIHFLIEDGEDYAREEAQEAACYAKGVYHYNGVLIRDFI